MAWPWPGTSSHAVPTDVVLASGRFQPKDGDLPGSATFIGKPFDASVVIQHLKRKLPDGRKPDPLKQAV